MPTVSVPKPPHESPTPETTESLKATVYNHTAGNLVLQKSGSQLPWDSPPPEVIAPGQSGCFVSPGDFVNAASGFVTYRAEAADGSAFTLSWTLPAVGRNHVTWDTGPGLSAHEIGSLQGWNVSATWFVRPG